MKLKTKNFNWHAGRPVVFLNEEVATKMNVFVDDRVAITNSKKIYAIVDIFSKLVKKNQIGISHELNRILKLKSGSIVEVSASEISDASFLIKKKLNGGTLSEKDLSFIVSEIVHNNLTEAEIAFFTSAQKLNGMKFKETINLTKAMVKTGARLKFKGKYVANKHCIGGVAGNRTTPIVIAICASLGIKLPKTSSRAITSASGTADVIETIANVEISLKKIATGAKYILIDIPYGHGAKVKDLASAKRLGRKFHKIAKHFKLKMKVIYTDGTQPIGDGFGPVLEMLDIIEVFKNNGPQDLKEKSIYLATELIKLCGIKNAKTKATESLESGKAYEKFKEIINAQNGKKNFNNKLKELKLAKFKKIIPAQKSGNITTIDNKGINSLCRILGTPETIAAGVYLHKHLEKIKKGEPLITLYSESRTKMKDAIKFLEEFKPIQIK